VFVQELDEVPAGGVVVFSAHGVSPTIAADAQKRGLIAYDAVCPLVAKVHREVERHQRRGREIILIGHKGHPEIEGTLGHVSSVRTHVVNSVDEVENLRISSHEPAAYAVQTTYSVDDARAIIQALHLRFADLVGPASSDICYATTNRQAAVREVALQSDAIIVAGEQFSSNACRLAEVASAHCNNVQLVAGSDEIDWSGLPKSGVIGITAAASTPETSVQSILSALGARYHMIVEELGSGTETTVFKRMAIA
jgi:4-hydroxy-3-methylbut-2-enyl diphosphate reductase